MNHLSALSTVIHALSLEGRKTLLSYLRQREPGSLPRALKTEIKKILGESLANMEFSIGALGQSKALGVEGMVALAIETMESFASRAQPSEKIPVLDLVLNAGKDPIADQPGFAEALAKGELKYTHDSGKLPLLLAFLDVIPKEEVTTSLSHLLSITGEDGGGSMRSIFEVFQTVGIKGGQLASLWGLFGPQISKELAELKDNAEPMSKIAVRKALKDAMGTEFSKIRRIKKVIGSASIKTVVLAELWDGREVVILVQRPHAEEVVETNILLAP